MSLFKALTRKRGVPGTLGPVQRSIGYLQGGYKDVTIHSRVQLFNITTQAGSIVYDTGFQRSYRPGISGAFAGFFSISDTTAYSKFNYITASAALSFTTLTHPSTTVSDLNIYSQAWILTTTTPSTTAGIDANWYKLNLNNDIITAEGNISPLPYGSTRQGMNTGAAGFFPTPASATLHAFNFTTKSIASAVGPAELDNSIQIPCGMSVDNTKGYIVGMLGRNVRVNVSGVTILSFAVATPYTYNFGESHAIVNASYGFMMAGYSDTTGRYGNTQHGLCQRIQFSTEAITTLPDLVLPQSSGQMMQGF